MHVANEKRQEIAYEQGHVSSKSRNFGRISGAIILFVSSKRWRLEARNYYEFIINFYSLDTYEKASFTK